MVQPLKKTVWQFLLSNSIPNIDNLLKKNKNICSPMTGIQILGTFFIIGPNWK